MKKFLVIYHASEPASKKMEGASEEEVKKEMGLWMEWKDKVGDGMVDMGNPLGSAHKMSKDGHGESKSTVVGYSMLQAESWDEVGEMLKGHPHLAMDDSCEIEVHEVMPIPGM